MKLALALLLCAPAALAQVRVEPRALVKDGHLFLSAGPAWLERHDEYANPGAMLDASFYLREDDAIAARFGFFLSSLSSAAQQIQSATGLKPDAQMPIALLLAGWKHGLTYGKLATGSTVVHFDVQSGLYAGTMITDASANPALATSVGVIARIGKRGFFQLDVALLGSLERRSSQVLALGVLPIFTLGWSL